MQCNMFQVEEEAHIQKMRTDLIAMRAQPMRRYLMSKLMPVLAKAILEAQTEQPGEPASYVAQQLLKVRLQAATCHWIRISN